MSVDWLIALRDVSTADIRSVWCRYTSLLNQQFRQDALHMTADQIHAVIQPDRQDLAEKSRVLVHALTGGQAETCDLVDVLAISALLCNDDWAAKAELLFVLFDYDTNGELVEDEFAFMVESVAYSCYCLGITAQLSQDALDDTTIAAFTTADGIMTDSMSLERFRGWFETSEFTSKFRSMFEAAHEPSRQVRELQLKVQLLAQRLESFNAETKLPVIPPTISPDTLGLPANYRDLTFESAEPAVRQRALQLQAEGVREYWTDCVEGYRQRWCIDGVSVVLGPIVGVITPSTAACLLEVDWPVNPALNPCLNDAQSAEITIHAVPVLDHEALLQLRTQNRPIGSFAHGTVVTQCKPREPTWIHWSTLQPHTAYKVLIEGASFDSCRTCTAIFTTLPEVYVHPKETGDGAAGFVLGHLHVVSCMAVRLPGVRTLEASGSGTVDLASSVTAYPVPFGNEALKCPGGAVSASHERFGDDIVHALLPRPNPSQAVDHKFAVRAAEENGEPQPVDLPPTMWRSAGSEAEPIGVQGADPRWTPRMYLHTDGSVDWSDEWIIAALQVLAGAGAAASGGQDDGWSEDSSDDGSAAATPAEREGGVGLPSSAPYWRDGKLIADPIIVARHLVRQRYLATWSEHGPVRQFLRHGAHLLCSMPEETAIPRVHRLAARVAGPQAEIAVSALTTALRQGAGAYEHAGWTRVRVATVEMTQGKGIMEEDNTPPPAAPSIWVADLGKARAVITLMGETCYTLHDEAMTSSLQFMMDELKGAPKCQAWLLASPSPLWARTRFALASAATFESISTEDLYRIHARTGKMRRSCIAAALQWIAEGKDRAVALVSGPVRVLPTLPSTGVSTDGPGDITDTSDQHTSVNTCGAVGTIQLLPAEAWNQPPEYGPLPAAESGTTDGKATKSKGKTSKAAAAAPTINAPVTVPDPWAEDPALLDTPVIHCVAANHSWAPLPDTPGQLAPDELKISDSPQNQRVFPTLRSVVDTSIIVVHHSPEAAALRSLDILHQRMVQRTRPGADPIVLDPNLSSPKDILLHHSDLVMVATRSVAVVPYTQLNQTRKDKVKRLVQLTPLLVPTRRQQCQLLLGPIIGSVTATQAVVLAEIDSVARVMAVATDVLSGKEVQAARYHGRAAFTGQLDAGFVPAACQPFTCVFEALDPGRRYAIEIRGVWRSAHRMGRLTTPFDSADGSSNSRSGTLTVATIVAHPSTLANRSTHSERHQLINVLHQANQGPALLHNADLEDRSQLELNHSPRHDPEVVAVHHEQPADLQPHNPDGRRSRFVTGSDSSSNDGSDGGDRFDSEYEGESEVFQDGQSDDGLQHSPCAVGNEPVIWETLVAERERASPAFDVLLHVGGQVKVRSALHELIAQLEQHGILLTDTSPAEWPASCLEPLRAAYRAAWNQPKVRKVLAWGSNLMQPGAEDLCPGLPTQTGLSTGGDAMTTGEDWPPAALAAARYMAESYQLSLAAPLIASSQEGLRSETSDAEGDSDHDATALGRGVTGWLNTTSFTAGAPSETCATQLPWDWSFFVRSGRHMIVVLDSISHRIDFRTFNKICSSTLFHKTTVLALIDNLPTTGAVVVSTGTPITAAACLPQVHDPNFASGSLPPDDESQTMLVHTLARWLASGPSSSFEAHKASKRACALMVLSGLAASVVSHVAPVADGQPSMWTNQDGYGDAVVRQSQSRPLSPERSLESLPFKHDSGIVGPQEETGHTVGTSGSLHAKLASVGDGKPTAACTDVELPFVAIGHCSMSQPQASLQLRHMLAAFGSEADMEALDDGVFQHYSLPDGMLRAFPAFLRPRRFPDAVGAQVANSSAALHQVLRHDLPRQTSMVVQESTVVFRKHYGLCRLMTGECWSSAHVEVAHTARGPRLVVGPVIGRVLSRSCRVLIETDVSVLDLQIVAVDALTNRKHVQSVSTVASRPKVVQFDGLTPSTTYVLSIYGIQGGLQRVGSFITPSGIPHSVITSHEWRTPTSAAELEAMEAQGDPSAESSMQSAARQPTSNPNFRPPPRDFTTGAFETFIDAAGLTTAQAKAISAVNLSQATVTLIGTAPPSGLRPVPALLPSLEEEQTPLSPEQTTDAVALHSWTGLWRAVRPPSPTPRLIAHAYPIFDPDPWVPRRAMKFLRRVEQSLVRANVAAMIRWVRSGDIPHALRPNRRSNEPTDRSVESMVEDQRSVTAAAGQAPSKRERQKQLKHDRKTAMAASSAVNRPARWLQYLASAQAAGDPEAGPMHGWYDMPPSKSGVESFVPCAVGHLPACAAEGWDVGFEYLGDSQVRALQQDIQAGYASIINGEGTDLPTGLLEVIWLLWHNLRSGLVEYFAHPLVRRVVAHSPTLFLTRPAFSATKTGSGSSTIVDAVLQAISEDYLEALWSPQQCLASSGDGGNRGAGIRTYLPARSSEVPVARVGRRDVRGQIPAMWRLQPSNVVQSTDPGAAFGRPHKTGLFWSLAGSFARDPDIDGEADGVMVEDNVIRNDEAVLVDLMSCQPPPPTFWRQPFLTRPAAPELLSAAACGEPMLNRSSVYQQCGFGAAAIPTLHEWIRTPPMLQEEHVGLDWPGARGRSGGQVLRWGGTAVVIVGQHSHRNCLLHPTTSQLHAERKWANALLRILDWQPFTDEEIKERNRLARRKAGAEALPEPKRKLKLEPVVTIAALRVSSPSGYQYHQPPDNALDFAQTEALQKWLSSRPGVRAVTVLSHSPLLPEWQGKSDAQRWRSAHWCPEGEEKYPMDTRFEIRWPVRVLLNWLLNRKESSAGLCSLRFVSGQAWSSVFGGQVRRGRTGKDGARRRSSAVQLRRETYAVLGAESWLQYGPAVTHGVQVLTAGVPQPNEGSQSDKQVDLLLYPGARRSVMLTETRRNDPPGVFRFQKKPAPETTTEIMQRVLAAVGGVTVTMQSTPDGSVIDHSWLSPWLTPQQAKRLPSELQAFGTLDARSPAVLSHHRLPVQVISGPLLGRLTSHTAVISLTVNGYTQLRLVAEDIFTKEQVSAQVDGQPFTPLSIVLQGLRPDHRYQLHLYGADVLTTAASVTWDGAGQPTAAHLMLNHMMPGGQGPHLAADIRRNVRDVSQESPRHGIGPTCIQILHTPPRHQRKLTQISLGSDCVVHRPATVQPQVVTGEAGHLFRKLVDMPEGRARVMQGVESMQKNTYNVKALLQTRPVSAWRHAALTVGSNSLGPTPQVYHVGGGAMGAGLSLPSIYDPAAQAACLLEAVTSQWTDWDEIREAQARVRNAADHSSEQPADLLTPAHLHHRPTMQVGMGYGLQSAGVLEHIFRAWLCDPSSATELSTFAADPSAEWVLRQVECADVGVSRWMEQQQAHCGGEMMAPSRRVVPIGAGPMVAMPVASVSTRDDTNYRVLPRWVAEFNATMTRRPAVRQVLASASNTFVPATADVLGTLGLRVGGCVDSSANGRTAVPRYCTAEGVLLPTAWLQARLALVLGHGSALWSTNQSTSAADVVRVDVKAAVRLGLLRRGLEVLPAAGSYRELIESAVETAKHDAKRFVKQSALQTARSDASLVRRPRLVRASSGGLSSGAEADVESVAQSPTVAQARMSEMTPRSSFGGLTSRSSRRRWSARGGPSDTARDLQLARDRLAYLSRAEGLSVATPRSLGSGTARSDPEQRDEAMDGDLMMAQLAAVTVEVAELYPIAAHRSNNVHHAAKRHRARWVTASPADRGTAEDWLLEGLDGAQLGGVGPTRAVLTDELLQEQNDFVVSTASMSREAAVRAAMQEPLHQLPDLQPGSIDDVPTSGSVSQRLRLQLPDKGSAYDVLQSGRRGNIGGSAVRSGVTSSVTPPVPPAVAKRAQVANSSAFASRMPLAPQSSVSDVLWNGWLNDLSTSPIRVSRTANTLVIIYQPFIGGLINALNVEQPERALSSRWAVPAVISTEGEHLAGGGPGHAPAYVPVLTPTHLSLLASLLDTEGTAEVTLVMDATPIVTRSTAEQLRRCGAPQGGSVQPATEPCVHDLTRLARGAWGDALELGTVEWARREDELATLIRLLLSWKAAGEHWAPRELVKRTAYLRKGKPAPAGAPLPITSTRGVTVLCPAGVSSAAWVQHLALGTAFMIQHIGPAQVCVPTDMAFAASRVRPKITLPSLPLITVLSSVVMTPASCLPEDTIDKAAAKLARARGKAADVSTKSTPVASVAYGYLRVWIETVLVSDIMDRGLAGRVAPQFIVCDGHIAGTKAHVPPIAVPSSDRDSDDEATGEAAPLTAGAISGDSEAPANGSQYLGYGNGFDGAALPRNQNVQLVTTDSVLSMTSYSLDGAGAGQLTLPTAHDGVLPAQDTHRSSDSLTKHPDEIQGLLLSAPQPIALAFHEHSISPPRWWCRIRPDPLTEARHAATIQWPDMIESLAQRIADGVVHRWDKAFAQDTSHAVHAAHSLNDAFGHTRLGKRGKHRRGLQQPVYAGADEVSDWLEALFDVPEYAPGNGLQLLHDPAMRSHPSDAASKQKSKSKLPPRGEAVSNLQLVVAPGTGSMPLFGATRDATALQLSSTLESEAAATVNSPDSRAQTARKDPGDKTLGLFSVDAQSELSRQQDDEGHLFVGKWRRYVIFQSNEKALLQEYESLIGLGSMEQLSKAAFDELLSIARRFRERWRVTSQLVEDRVEAESEWGLGEVEVRAEHYGGDDAMPDVRDAMDKLTAGQTSWYEVQGELMLLLEACVPEESPVKESSEESDSSSDGPKVSLSYMKKKKPAVPNSQAASPSTATARAAEEAEPDVVHEWHAALPTPYGVAELRRAVMTLLAGVLGVEGSSLLASIDDEYLWRYLINRTKADCTNPVSAAQLQDICRELCRDALLVRVASLWNLRADGARRAFGHRAVPAHDLAVAAAWNSLNAALDAMGIRRSNQPRQGHGASDGTYALEQAQLTGRRPSNASSGIVRPGSAGTLWQTLTAGTDASLWASTPPLGLSDALRLQTQISLPAAAEAASLVASITHMPLQWRRDLDRQQHEERARRETRKQAEKERARRMRAEVRRLRQKGFDAAEAKEKAEELVGAAVALGSDEVVAKMAQPFDALRMRLEVDWQLTHDFDWLVGVDMWTKVVEKSKSAAERRTRASVAAATPGWKASEQERARLVKTWNKEKPSDGDGEGGSSPMGRLRALRTRSTSPSKAAAPSVAPFSPEGRGTAAILKLAEAARCVRRAVQSAESESRIHDEAVAAVDRAERLKWVHGLPTAEPVAPTVPIHGTGVNLDRPPRPVPESPHAAKVRADRIVARMATEDSVESPSVDGRGSETARVLGEDRFDRPQQPSPSSLEALAAKQVDAELAAAAEASEAEAEAATESEG